MDSASVDFDCPVGLAEQAHGTRGEPVWQGWLVKVAKTVDVQRDEVVAYQHLARGFRMDGVHVVKQRRRKQAGKLSEAPEQNEESDGADVDAARLYCEGTCGRERLCVVKFKTFRGCLDVHTICARSSPCNVLQRLFQVYRFDVMRARRWCALLAIRVLDAPAL